MSVLLLLINLISFMNKTINFFQIKKVNIVNLIVCDPFCHLELDSILIILRREEQSECYLKTK